MNITGKIPELKQAQFDIKALDPQMRHHFCNLVTASIVPYTSQSGRFEITKLALYQDAGIGAANYFMDATFKIELKGQADASQEITVEGTVSGINTSVL